MINVSEEVKKMLQTDMLKSFIKADTEIIDNKHSYWKIIIKLCQKLKF